MVKFQACGHHRANGHGSPQGHRSVLSHCGSAQSDCAMKLLMLLLQLPAAVEHEQVLVPKQVRVQPLGGTAQRMPEGSASQVLAPP